MTTAAKTTEKTAKKPVRRTRRTAAEKANLSHRTNRRRHIDPTTCERDYTADEVEFMNAVAEYKRTSGRKFPTYSEMLEVLRSLGYTKTSDTETTPEQTRNHEAAIV